ncbi:MAG: DnaA regulatory inactivator Hda [Proteobacteria bacterium]|nr:DnaA regulatory inactivator Hda [Pseudomonadota bacterium]
MSDAVDAARQIPLPFGKFDRFDFDSYLACSNQELVQHLQKAGSGDETKNIFLWGMAGTGKSHLLQAVCSSAGCDTKNVAYIPLAQADELSPELLQGLEQMDIVCVDDLQHIAGQAPWEQALLHLFNRLRDQQRAMIIASKYSPQVIDIDLPDLRSRLCWDLVFHLQPLDEKKRVEALQRRARARGFTIPDEVADYLGKRAARDTHSLFKLLDKLDEASLVAKKKLTIPFVRDLLGL